jgi:hypothetical protein
MHDKRASDRNEGDQSPRTIIAEEGPCILPVAEGLLDAEKLVVRCGTSTKKGTKRESIVICQRLLLRRDSRAQPKLVFVIVRRIVVLRIKDSSPRATTSSHQELLRDPLRLRLGWNDVNVRQMCASLTV